MESIYTFSMFLSLISFAIATAFTPGPNNLMLLSSGLTFGYKQTLPHIMGVAVGFPIMVLVVGFGVGEIFEYTPWVYTTLKVVGFAYLLWMAWHIAHTTGSIDADLNRHTQNKPFTFLQAVFFQWVNPKAWIMAVTATTTFTTEDDFMWYQVVIIAVVYLFVGIGSTHTWALGGMFLRKWLKSAKAIIYFNRVMALLIVLAVIPLI